ncbi:MAG: glycosyltransferase [Clostridia bacterium]|nr:glycosyltransferase [Clostridia bacterium]
MDKLISVIIPVHNSADTIDRCVESVANQTHSNLEIILVENGSQDNTLELCNKWAEKDSRVKVFVSEKGVSKARNLGLDMATGEYFAFVDSDDYIDVTTYEKCLDSIIAEEADMVFFLTNSECQGVVTPVIEKNIEDLVFNKNVKYFFCNGSEYVRSGTIRALFSANKFKGIRYVENICCGEDLVYNLQCLDVSERRAIINEHLYYNVNSFDIPHNFVRRYVGRDNFWTSRQAEIENSEKYIIKYCSKEILDAVKFHYLVQYLNAIIVTDKNYKKAIKKFLENLFWKDAHNMKNYKAYCKHLICNAGKASKIQAFLLAHKMYGMYSLAMKIYERKF